MVDLQIIFPPQWSPFQPFLSTPSLKAYLSKKGFTVQQMDWNVDFYKFFISKKRLAKAIKRLKSFASNLPEEFEEYKAKSILALSVLENYEIYYSKTQKLRDQKLLQDVAGFEDAVFSFRRLLEAFSTAEPVIDIGTSSFSAGQVLSSYPSLFNFLENRADNPFIGFYEEKIRQLEPARFIGVSIIGSEQVVPGLTLGHLIKSNFPETPVIIGGSVFSRLVDKGEGVKELFGRCFDLVCRYEGEKPMAAILESGTLYSKEIPSIAFVEKGRIVKTPVSGPLGMNETPTPDFSDLNLVDYYSPEVVLPLLTTRGCYWDKCAFCYHGMIYGERYRMRQPEEFAKDIKILNKKHGVKHFALNDEAIPPKLFRKLPEVLPNNTYSFTGLIKFETYFKAEDFNGMYDIGFRSLYIGLETASERVQRHMRKNNLRSTMIKNLKDASKAGIWNHAFAFFGFPTETREEAFETVHFLVENANIVHSEGTGTFSFEHNAPIFKDPANYGVKKIFKKPGRILELYYDYEVVEGLSASEASAMVKEFNQIKKERKVFQYGGWIPREHLLLLLSKYTRKQLFSALEKVETGRAGRGKKLKNFKPVVLKGSSHSDSEYYLANVHLGKIYETNKDALIVYQELAGKVEPKDFILLFPEFEAIAADWSVSQN